MEILKEKKEVIENADLLFLVNFPKVENIETFKNNSSVVGFFNPKKNIDIIKKLIDKN